MSKPDLVHWSPDSWRARTALQQPRYEDSELLASCLREIAGRPALVHQGEVLALRQQIAEAGEGKRFILQAGDCAERFVDCSPKSISDKLKIILQMSLILVYGLRRPVVRIGRIAGQYAKPRSDDLETLGGISLPSFRGDIINGIAFEEEARRHDPRRLVQAHTLSCYTLNSLRALVEGGFADVRHPEMWKLDHVSEHHQPRLYTDLSDRVRESTRFMELLGGANPDFMRRVEFFTSHEGLLLDYESALTHWVSVPGAEKPGWFNLGAHMLWLGERTRQLDGAHAEYLRGIENPLGIKVGPTADPAEIVSLVQCLNPNNVPGRITVITRMGAGRVRGALPGLVKALHSAKVFVTYSCDPMHGNAIKTQNGIKTRDFASILAELNETQAVHKESGSLLGGVHFELTGENVTECIGGGGGLAEEHLTQNYQTACDPRLNYSQSMEMAYLISDGFAK
ncbi:MAG: 3-deoxy-7-phosphoheptulonate synthase [Silvanigrellales bacterium]|nr:3-deoxy-7-phosphoheptulonate synthase [Silvanigrellales bacterium]